MATDTVGPGKGPDMRSAVVAAVEDPMDLQTPAKDHTGGSSGKDGAVNEEEPKISVGGRTSNDSSDSDDSDAEKKAKPTDPSGHPQLYDPDADRQKRRRKKKEKKHKKELKKLKKKQRKHEGLTTEEQARMEKLEKKEQKRKKREDGNDDEMAGFIEHDGNTDDEDDVIKVAGGIDSDNDISDSEQQRGQSYFDEVIKSMRSRKKRTTKISDVEMQEFVSRVLQRMRETAELDRESLKNGQPATAKLFLLHECLAEMSKPKFVHWFVQEGVCQVLADWLCPLEDGSLPNITIRTQLLQLLHKLPIFPSDLINNSLGRRLVTMWNHPDETDDNRVLVRGIVTQWMRPLLGSSSDFKDQQRQYQEENEYNDYSQGGSRPTSRPKPVLDLATLEPEATKGRRAIPPSRIGVSFTIQPKSNLEEAQANRARGSVQERKLTADNSRTSLNQARKAQKVSVEGRGMY